MDWQNGIRLHQKLRRLSEDERSNIQYNDCKVFVGKEQRDNGCFEFYIFWCPICDNFSYDCPHGSAEEQYLACHRCSRKIDFSPWWAQWKKGWKVFWACLLGGDDYAE